MCCLTSQIKWAPIPSNNCFKHGLRFWNAELNRTNKVLDLEKPIFSMGKANMNKCHEKWKKEWQRNSDFKPRNDLPQRADKAAKTESETRVIEIIRNQVFQVEGPANQKTERWGCAHRELTEMAIRPEQGEWVRDRDQQVGTPQSGRRQNIRIPCQVWRKVSSRGVYLTHMLEGSF